MEEKHAIILNAVKQCQSKELIKPKAGAQFFDEINKDDYPADFKRQHSYNWKWQCIVVTENEQYKEN